MAEEWHAPYERLSPDTITRHRALRSLMEELEAVDWYRQRADDCADEALKAILLHNMREEIEHATMLLEWLRRADADFAATLDAYLYTRGDIAEREKAAEAERTDAKPEVPMRRFTVGPLK
ncbi:MAG: ferritin [Magnetospirillum sp.]|nr:ferritin [Magnetospirillum sp.]